MKCLKRTTSKEEPFLATAKADVLVKKSHITVTMGFLDPWVMQDLLQSNQHLNLTYY